MHFKAFFLVVFLVYSCIFAEQKEFFPPDSAFTSESSPKSELVAYGLAIGLTVVPLVPVLVSKPSNPLLSVALYSFAGIGLLAGPSTGEMYAGSGNSSTGNAGAAIRGVGVITMLTGEIIYAVSSTAAQLHRCPPPSHINCGDECDDQWFPFAFCPEEPSNAGLVIADLGEGLLISGIIFSLVDTHFEVKRNNRRGKSALNFNLVPEISLVPNQKPTMGGKVLLTF